MALRSSNLISAFHHLRKAELHLELVAMESKGGIGHDVATKYIKKIEWMKTDCISIPVFPDIVRAGLRKEWACDVLAVDNIRDSIELLAPEQRELVETLIEALLNREEIIIAEKS